MLLRAALATGQFFLERTIQDVVHERGFAGAADSRERGQRTERNVDVHLVDVMECRAEQAQAMLEFCTARNRRWLGDGAQISAGAGLGGIQLIEASLEDDAPTFFTTARPQLDDVIGNRDRGR